MTDSILYNLEIYLLQIESNVNYFVLFYVNWVYRGLLSLELPDFEKQTVLPIKIACSSFVLLNKRYASQFHRMIVLVVVNKFIKNYTNE